MKIEIDKPVVPQWFDEWYRSMKYAGDRDTFILKVMFSVNHYGRYNDYRRDNGFFDKDQFTYISDNFMKVINAIQFGYEVEQEQKYYVINKEKELILGWSQSAYMTPCIEGYEYMKHNGRENLFQLTEQEIKDYDERFWAFAEPVKEVEFRLSF